MNGAGQLMTCTKSLQAIWNVAKKSTSVKTYLEAKLQTARTEEEEKKGGQSVADEESNWNLLLPPLGRAQATSPQHKPCLLLPVAKCGFSIGHVQLKTFYSNNYSEFATSARVVVSGPLGFTATHSAFSAGG